MYKKILVLTFLLGIQSFSKSSPIVIENLNFSLDQKIPSKVLENRKRPTKTIIASTIHPGFNDKNATASFVNAIKRANRGDTVVIDNVKGSNGIWHIAGRHPNWFDGKKGHDRVANDLTIIFEKGVTLKAIEDTYDHKSGLDMLFRLENISGWKILGYGAKFEMDKSLLPEGEYRNSIALYDCSDMVLEGLKVVGSGGDGIYIGSRTPNGFSENITLNNMHFKDHRRQAMSILSARNLSVQNAKFNGTLGRKPMSGLDFEGGIDHRLDTLKFKNVEFAHNGYTGILFALSHMNHTTVPIHVEFDGVYVFDNWKAQGDLDPAYKKAAIALGMGGGGNTALKGSVTFSNLLIKDEKFNGLFSLKHHDSYNLVFNDLVIKNVGTHNFRGARNAIHTSRYNYDSPLPSVGNITFNGLLILEARNVPFWQLEGDSDDGWSIDNVTIDNALIVSPNIKSKAINNTTNAKKGPGTVLGFKSYNSIPKTILNIKRNNLQIPRGSNGSFTINRTSDALNYPLAVEYSISGSASNMDDYDLLHGYVIIPANSDHVDIPIHARIKNGDNKTLTITLTDTPDYTLGNIIDQTVHIVSE